MENPVNQLTRKKSSVAVLSTVIAIAAILTAIGAAIFSLIYSALIYDFSLQLLSLNFSTDITRFIMTLVLPVCLFIAAFSEKSGFPKFLLAVTVLVFLVQIGAAVLYLIVYLLPEIGVDLMDFSPLFTWVPGSMIFTCTFNLIQYFTRFNLIGAVAQGLYLLETVLCVAAAIVSALKRR